MIYSMTAYSQNEVTKDELVISTEIRAYNSRHLDIALRIPYGYIALEDLIKKRIAEKMTRGRVEIKVKIKNEAPAFCEFDINMAKARAYHQALNELQQGLGLDNSFNVDLILKAGDIITPVDVNEDMVEAIWPVMDECLTGTLDGLNQMRRKEGDFIANDFNERLDFIQSCLEKIEAQSGGLLEAYQERLKERIASLTKGMVEIDPARISQEAAILADKSDISEEITRARSHIKQFRSLMSSPEPAGRKLNFLLQEFNREFNTMGSKSGNADLAHLIVTVKSELEKIREQVQNIE